MEPLDLLGYTALLIALLSFLQNNIYVLRVMGIIASVIFCIHAYLTDMQVYVVANICFALVHLYWIVKYKMNKVVDKVAKK